MAEDLKHQILEYMESHNTMTLGTCQSDVPWAATVFYASDGLRLYFFSAPDSRHCQNLAANARVAVTIQEDYRDWRKIKGIQLEGRVARVDSLIEKGRIERDTEKRKALMFDLQRHLAKAWYTMNMPGAATGFTMAWPAVGNFRVFRGSRYNYRLWVDDTKAPFKGA